MENKKNILAGLFVLIILVITGCSTEHQTESGITGNVVLDFEDEVVAVVNGNEILSSEVDLMKQSFARQGQIISNPEVIEQIINQKLVLGVAQEKGFFPSVEDAESEIETQLMQQGMTIEDYKTQIEIQGLSYSKQIEAIRGDIAIHSYLNAIIANSDIQVTEEEVLEFYEFYKEQAGDNVPPFEELESQIIMTLEQERENEVISLVIDKLRKDAVIEYK